MAGLSAPTMPPILILAGLTADEFELFVHYDHKDVNG